MPAPAPDGTLSIVQVGSFGAIGDNVYRQHEPAVAFARLGGGEAGNDTLDGSSGRDSLIGGAGDDTYIHEEDGSLDSVVEDAGVGEGSDTVRSWLSVNLALYPNVENVLLVDQPGPTPGVFIPTDSNAIGSNLDNLLTGNTGNNRLDGLAGNDTLDGGAGIDSLSGGDGNDSYIIQDIGDLVVESNAVAATGGVDMVLSVLATYTLTANVENLTLTGVSAINRSGTSLNNVIIGNTAANTLDGNTGNNTLTGGLAADVFRFDSAL